MQSCPGCCSLYLTPQDGAITSRLLFRLQSHVHLQTPLLRATCLSFITELFSPFCLVSFFSCLSLCCLRSLLHLSVRFCVNPPTLCNLALCSLLTLNCSRSFQNDDSLGLVCGFLMATLFKSIVCVCVWVCLRRLSGCRSLAGFDCECGDYVELIMYDPNMYNSCRSRSNSLP